MKTKKFNEKWGLAIAEARKKAELTQTELAAITGISLTKIAKYEKAFTIPQVDVYERLLDACHTLSNRRAGKRRPGKNRRKKRTG